MDTLTGFFDKAVSWLLLPATAFGACGAFFSARHKGKSVSETAICVAGGAVVANVTMPLVCNYAPQSWHWTAFFIVGWGGLHLVELAYGVFAKWIARKVRTELGDEDWNGIERRREKR